jgi:hypothetical protein
MKNSLRLCSTYLKELESKLIELQECDGDDSETKWKIIKALGFIEMAHDAVSQNKPSGREPRFLQ